MNNFPDPTDLKKRDFSLAVLAAKPSFIDWINQRIEEGMPQRQHLYQAEDDVVAFIPNRDLFAGYSSKPTYGSYDEFLAELKPRLLRMELARFGLTEAQFGQSESERTLCEFFELSFRDTVVGISEQLAGTLEHLETVNLSRRDFSLALMTPKLPFLEWLDQYSKVAFNGKFKPAQLYPIEYRGVIVVPKKAQFTDSASFISFLDRLKPSLISMELTKLGRNSRREFEYPDTKETFDAFFDLQVRDSILFMSDLLK